jgi:hypothetical protein
MSRYKMLSDKSVHEFRQWLKANPWLITMPRPTYTNEHVGAHDAMPSKPEVRARLKRMMAADHLDHEDHSMDQEPHGRLRAFLKSRGLSADDIEHVCGLLDGLAADDPTDLGFGGEPRPGGGKTAFRPDGSGNTREELKYRAPGPGAKDTRRAAMDAVMAVGTDAPPPSRSAYQTPDMSTRALKDFAARWPGAAGIKVS